MYRNAEELSRHATQFLTGRRFSRDVDDDFEKELVRFLHNYLTSVYSLIEAQRVVMRHCWVMARSLRRASTPTTARHRSKPARPSS